MFARVFNLAEFRYRNLVVWFLMAFQAGSINAGGFLGLHRFVSHTTGFATTFGESFARGRIASAVATASVPIFFLIGVMISAYFVDLRLARHRQPQYTGLMVCICLLLLAAGGGGLLGWFGAFDTPAGQEPSYPLLAILCLACGIQNACITSASGAVVRTTHLTGLTTDLGIGLMRFAAENQEPKVRTAEGRATLMRVGVIASFTFGSTVGSLVFLTSGFVGFFIPVGITGGLILIDIWDRLKKHGGPR